MKPSRRRRNQRIAQDVLAVLVAEYPQCFSLAESERRPLALGIGGTILAENPELKRSHIGQALSWYVHSRAYLERMIADTPRIDLLGQPCGTVSALESIYAAEKLKAARTGRRRSRRQHRLPRRRS
jgi:sRNA-binding protein